MAEKENNSNLTTERDNIQQELTELRTKLNTLAKSFQEAQVINQQVYDILGKYSNQTELLLRSQEVVEKIKELKDWRIMAEQEFRRIQNELTSVRQELDKEKNKTDEQEN